jgi:hypothetical protein
MRNGLERVDERHVGKDGHVARVLLREHAGKRFAKDEWNQIQFGELAALQM